MHLVISGLLIYIMQYDCDQTWHTWTIFSTCISWTFYLVSDAMMVLPIYHQVFLVSLVLVGSLLRTDRFLIYLIHFILMLNYVCQALLFQLSCSSVLVTIFLIILVNFTRGVTYCNGSCVFYLPNSRCITC